MGRHEAQGNDPLSQDIVANSAIPPREIKDKDCIREYIARFARALRRCADLRVSRHRPGGYTHTDPSPDTVAYGSSHCYR